MAKINHMFSLRFFILKCVSILITLGSINAFSDPLLNGVAVHRELGKEQFVAGLYISTLSNSSNAILLSQEDKRLQVRILVSQLSNRRFKRMWIEGMAINASSQELKKHARNMASYSNLLKIKMVAGDIFTVDRSNSIVSISVNGTLLGEIEDPSFFDLLLRTWIGPVPLSSDFRQSLLTNGDIDSDMLARFEDTRPSDERIALIGEAVRAKRSEQPAAQIASSGPNIEALSLTTSISAPKTAAPENKVAIAAPKITASTPTPEPKPKPTPTPQPEQIVLAPAEEELDESIFDDSDEDEFTAEGLLKEQLYYSQLAKYTHRYLKYPQKAWDRGREGNVRLRVTIDRDGQVRNTEVVSEALYRSLNREATKAVKRAAPYPSIPDEIGGDEYTFTFRIAFRIVDQ